MRVSTWNIYIYHTWAVLIAVTIMLYQTVGRVSGTIKHMSNNLVIMLHTVHIFIKQPLYLQVINFSQ
jgi:hypothetical protein